MVEQQHGLYSANAASEPEEQVVNGGGSDNQTGKINKTEGWRWRDIVEQEVFRGRRE